jgi:SAM-dependent methyltransferase
MVTIKKTDSTHYNALWELIDLGSRYVVLKVLEQTEIPFRIGTSFLPQLIQEIGPGRMLDLGCGTGNNVMRVFSECGWDCVGVDVDATSLEEASRYGQTILRKGEEPLYWLQDNSFDLVAAQAVFHHMRDVDGNLSELVRCVKPGRLLLIYEVVEDSLLLRLGRNVFKKWKGMPVYSRLHICDWLEAFQRHRLNLLCAYGLRQWAGSVLSVTCLLSRSLCNALAKRLKLKRLVLTHRGYGQVQFVLFILQKPQLVPCGVDDGEIGKGDRRSWCPLGVGR